MLTTTERVKLVYGGVITLFGCFALTGVGFAGFQAREAAVTLSNNADAITASAVQRIEALDEPIQRATDLEEEAHSLMLHTDMTTTMEQHYLLKEIPLTVAKFNAVLDTAQISVASLQPATAAAARTLDETTERLHDLQPVEMNAAATMLQATATLHDADVVVTDPQIKEAIASAADSVKQGDAILTDGRKVADKYVQPQKWYVKTLGYVLKGGELTWDFLR